MADLIFKFSVSDEGVFSYEPFVVDPGPPPETVSNWPYTHRDSVSFRCAKGPFTIRQRRTDAATPGLPDSFGGPVEAVQDPNLGNDWVAKVPVIQDGLSDELRRQLWQAHGFISNYRYVFGVLNGTKVAVDDNQTGIQSC